MLTAVQSLYCICLPCWQYQHFVQWTPHSSKNIAFFDDSRQDMAVLIVLLPNYRPLRYYLRCFHGHKNLSRWPVWSFLPLFGAFVAPPKLSFKKWPKKQAVRWVKCEYDLKMVLTDLFGARIIVAAWPEPIFDAFTETKIWAGGHFGHFTHFGGWYWKFRVSHNLCLWKSILTLLIVLITWDKSKSG